MALEAKQKKTNSKHLNQESKSSGSQTKKLTLKAKLENNSSGSQQKTNSKT